VPAPGVPPASQASKSEMARGEIRLVDLTKRFADVTAVDTLNLEIPGGEFFSLLGPSGCGKTTTLRLIAGFEQPSEGRILLDGTDVAYTPPHRRNVNTVFQNYALFPHLNVFDNIAFGLRRAKRPKPEIKERVAHALELVQLTGYEKRKSSQLSGGQQQRVALARALVLNPAVLLLDEPLGALDAKLRKALQIELKTLQQEVGITFLYVTHDQEEALTMSDRLAVMNAGRVDQVGAPRDVYEDPETLFVANFLGISNLIDATARGARDSASVIAVEGFELQARGGDTGFAGPAKIIIRPERVELEPHGSPGGPNRLPGMVERLVYVGSAVQVMVRAATGETLQALVQNTGQGVPYEQGTPVQLHLPADALRVLPAQDGSEAEGAETEGARARTEVAG
jgi:spermidine/putrescine transport system ATP-binding protein